MNLESPNISLVSQKTCSNYFLFNNNDSNIRALKLSNLENFRALKLSDFGSFRALKPPIWQGELNHVRSVLEYNYNVWFSSITNDEREDIETLQSLSDRRQSLAKRFALKCANSDKFGAMFPLNQNSAETRNTEKYVVKFAKSGRLQKSSIPAMQKLLNRE